MPSKAAAEFISSYGDPGQVPYNACSYQALTKSSTCGWLYFIAWSLSFYPQPILNFRRKTTKGLVPDFPLLNIFGFSCYTISTALFLYSPLIQDQYAARHPASPRSTVRVNDLIFGLHALVLSVITYSQFWPQLWGWKGMSGVQRHINKTTLSLVCGSLLALVVTSTIVIVADNDFEGKGWGWIDLLYCMTYIKLLLTIFKYIPQMVANFKRRSTKGWSINQILMDFTGGILSLVQLVIDSSLQADWSGLFGNPVKLGLANISLAFDLIFMTQHYVLYGAVENSGEHDPEDDLVDPAHGPRLETEPLLHPDDDDR